LFLPLNLPIKIKTYLSVGQDECIRTETQNQLNNDMRQYLDIVGKLLEDITKPIVIPKPRSKTARHKPLTPAEQFIQTVSARCNRCTLETWDNKSNIVHLGWLEGNGGLAPYLCKIADELGVTLKLMVEVVDTEYGGKLVPYYKKNGFEIVDSDFPDDYDFLNMPSNPKDTLVGEVAMDRFPQKTA